MLNEDMEGLGDSYATFSAEGFGWFFYMLAFMEHKADQTFGIGIQASKESMCVCVWWVCHANVSRTIHPFTFNIHRVSV